MDAECAMFIHFARRYRGAPCPQTDESVNDDSLPDFRDRAIARYVLAISLLRVVLNRVYFSRLQANLLTAELQVAFFVIFLLLEKNTLKMISRIADKGPTKQNIEQEHDVSRLRCESPAAR